MRNLIIGLSMTVVLAGCASTSSNATYAPEADRETIRRVVASHNRAVSACYEQTIDVRPGAMGKVLADWDIKGDGTVTNVTLPEIDPSMVDIRDCLMREISSWKFPASGGPDLVNVRYPFFFDERAPVR